MATLLTTRKSVDRSLDRSPLSRQIDEWTRLSGEARDKVLGQGYLENIQEFYTLADSGAQGNPIPTFRPTIKIPELQTLMLYEANDLSESSPVVYITNNSTGEAEEEREKTFQAEWSRARVNYHTMFAMLWALFGGLGVLQMGIDPDKRGGLGQLWAKARDPRTYFPDHTTDYDLDRSFEILEEPMHFDEIRRRWPLTSAGLKPAPTSTPQHSLLGPAGTGLTMPDGPMQSVGGLPSNKATPSDTRLPVRWCYCKDYTRIAAKVEKKLLPGGAITDPDANRSKNGSGSPDLEWKYPNGRLIIECAGRILSDGDNPWPLGMFPTVPFWSMPPMFGIWGVPAVRYSVTLQNVAERLMTGVFENAVRLNNGVWFIHSNTGIDAEAFGGIPGEVCVINPNSQVPQCVFPSQMPAHFTQIPAGLLDRQKALQGFTPARSGNPGSGNLSPELYDESVLRSQGLTQLRGRLSAVSIQRFAELWFYTMARFYTQKRTNLIKTDEGRKPVEWKPLDYGMQGRPDVFDVEIDEASIQPLSNTVLRKMVPELMKSKVLSVRRGLNMLNFPHAEEIAKEHEQEMALEALSRAKGVRR
jgi:hypothetical protein